MSQRPALQDGVATSRALWQRIRPETILQFPALTLRSLVRGESHGSGEKGEKGNDLEGLHGELRYYAVFVVPESGLQ